MLKTLFYVSATTIILLGPLSCGTVTENLGNPPYYGPGDVQPTAASGWWGLRAFSMGVVGNNIADIRCHNTTANTDTVVTIASTNAGDFDVATLQSECPGDTYYVQTLYDQSGSGQNLTQATLAQQPQLALNCIGTLPCLVFTSSPATSLTGTLGAAIPQPLTVAAVGMTSSASAQNIIQSSTTPNQFASLGYVIDSSTPPLLYPNISSLGGTTLNASASIAKNSYHLYTGIFSSTVSTLQVDQNSIATGDTGTNGFNPTFVVGGTLNGDMLEVGIWATAFSPLNVQTLSTSDSSYWGF